MSTDLENLLTRLGDKILNASTVEGAKGKSADPEYDTLHIAVPVPTEMCRVSPFFPLSKNALSRREYIEDLVIASTGWGEITYTGPRLSVYEEDALIAILAVLRSKPGIFACNKNRYVYEGPLLPFLTVYCGGRRPSRRDYRRFLRKIRLLSSTTIEMKVYETDGDRREEINRITGASLIVYYRWDEQRRQVSFALNPYFYEVYMNERFTLLDAIVRIRLNKPASKALYRFILSHTGKFWRGHYMTLARAINLSDIPSKKIRATLREAIRELQEMDVLHRGSGFLKESPFVVRLIKKSHTVSV